MKYSISLRYLLFVAYLAFPLCFHAQITPTDLRIEHRYGDVLIDASYIAATHSDQTDSNRLVPRFSWINKPTTTAQDKRQSAYRICVATSRKALETGRADVWDSRKVKSEQSYLVEYAGKPLNEATSYYWRVRVWDEKGKASAWSKTEKFTVGLSSDRWKAQWIGAPWVGEAAQYDMKQGKATTPPTPVPLLRKAFDVHDDILTAKAFVTGLGFFELYINGSKVGNDVLVPDFTNYTSRPNLKHSWLSLDEKSSGYHVSYLQYDITDMLKTGRNAVGAMVAGGYFDNRSSHIGAFMSPRFLCRIEITCRDGSTISVVTDDSWTVHESPIVSCEMYEGENYDARKEIADWCSPTFDDSAWQRAVVRKAPDGILTAHDTPADKVVETLKPIEFKRNNDGSYSVDFGEMISGWVHFKGIKGAAGQKIQIIYESEYPQQVSYTFKDNAPTDYSPHFTWYVFQSVRISGVELNEDMLFAEAVNSDMKVDCEFSSSNALFNMINKIWQRTEKDNVHCGVESDCPHRERLPYTGDGQVVCTTVMHNFDAASFYRSWFDTMRDSQDFETGYVPNSAPWCIGAGGGVAWGAAMTLMPWEHYLYYGDVQVLRENYAVARKQVEYMTRWVKPNGTMHQHRAGVSDGKEQYWFNLGDWVPAVKFPEDEKVHTYTLWRCADRLSRMAAVLGLESDVSHYRELSLNTAKAFDRAYYNASDRSYGDFGCNIMAVDMGAANDKLDIMKETIRKEIEEKYNGHINCGYIGTALFYETLARLGLNDLAYTAMDKTTFPSFGYWISQGATTFCEYYDGTKSRNHPFLGGALTWFYRTLAGVYADEKEPAYKHIIIRPTLAKELHRVKYSKQTPYGRVSSEVQHDASNLTITVEVPVGTYATIYVPAPFDTEPTVNGTTVDNVRGIKSFSHDADNYVIVASQGRYVIQSKHI